MIAFDSYQPGGRAEILLVDSDGRNLHAIISPPFDCAVPSWSRDGKAIYYSAHRDGAWQVWNHNLDTGAETQLTHQGGFDGLEPTDGKTVYYSRLYETGIWKTPAKGGAETADGKTIYFTQYDRQSVIKIMEFAR